MWYRDSTCRHAASFSVDMAARLNDTRASDATVRYSCRRVSKLPDKNIFFAAFLCPVLSLSVLHGGAEAIMPGQPAYSLLAGIVYTVSSAPTLRMTIAPAPTVAPLPIDSLGSRAALEPKKTPSPTVTPPGILT